MFNLIYRDGAPENTGHYEVFGKATGSGKGLKAGTLVNVAAGTASAYTSGAPYGVVAINAADGEDAVTVLRITDDMIFGASLTGSASVGGALKHTATGVGTATTTGYGFQITEVVSDKLVKGRFVNLG